MNLVLALGVTLQEGAGVSDEALRKDLERIWSEVRKAFDEYRLDDVKKYVDVPEGAPVPNRGQAKEFAAQLPDLVRGRFLKVIREGDRAGYYTRTDRPGDEEVAVALIRFQKAGAGWKLVPAPHTMSVYSTNSKVDETRLLKMAETEGHLKLFSSERRDESAPAANPKVKDQDSRPEAEIRKELEGVWRRIRDAFAAGKPENAKDLLLLEVGRKLPTPDEAKGMAKDPLPDLVRGQFLKLGWRADKPELVGYYGLTNVGDAKQSTIVLVVFVRKDGAWKFAPGPASIVVVQIPHAGRAAILKLIESDSRFKL